MEALTAEQEEIRAFLSKVQTVAQNCIPALNKLWDMWLAGCFGRQENELRGIMEILLLASQCPQGEALFIKALEYIKTDYPRIAGELWEAFDDWDNIHKTDYFRTVNDEK